MNDSSSLDDCATASVKLLECDMIQDWYDVYPNCDGVNYCNCEIETPQKIFSLTEYLDLMISEIEKDVSQLNCGSIRNPCKNSNGVADATPTQCSQRQSKWAACNMVWGKQKFCEIAQAHMDAHAECKEVSYCGCDTLALDVAIELAKMEVQSVSSKPLFCSDNGCFAHCQLQNPCNSN